MEISMVISNNSDAKGLIIASENKLPTLVLDTNQGFDNELSEIIEMNSIGLVVLAGFMKIIPKTITDKYDGMILNLHPSLLPKHKGLDTHKKVIQAKDKFHGASVHYVTSKLDNGPVIIQGKYEVDNYDENIMKDQVHKIEYQILPIAIKWFVEGNITKIDNKFSFNKNFDASISLKFFLFFNIWRAFFSNPFAIITSRKVLLSSMAKFFVTLKLHETIPPNALMGSQARASL